MTLSLNNVDEDLFPPADDTTEEEWEAGKMELDFGILSSLFDWFFKKLLLLLGEEINVDPLLGEPLLLLLMDDTRNWTANGGGDSFPSMISEDALEGGTEEDKIPEAAPLLDLPPPGNENDVANAVWDLKVITVDPVVVVAPEVMISRLFGSRSPAKSNGINFLLRDGEDDTFPPGDWCDDTGEV